MLTALEAEFTRQDTAARAQFAPLSAAVTACEQAPAALYEALVPLHKHARNTKELAQKRLSSHDQPEVHFPESESDLRPMESSPAFGSLKSAPDSLLRKAALAQGIPLWHWLSLAALTFLAMESLIHAWQPIRKTESRS